MLAEPLTAEKAEVWGLIWKCVDDDKLEAEVAAVAAKLAMAPTYALALAKRALAQASTNTLSQQLDLERDLQQLAGASPDAREGIAAFSREARAEVHREKGMTRDPAEIAQAERGRHVGEKDKASQGLGMQVLEVGPVRARLAVPIPST